MKSSFPTLLFTPVHAALGAKIAGPFDGVARLQVPELKGKQAPRPRLNLAIVIDVSGSMLGSPLQQAIEATASMVGNLTEHDRVAVIAYDSTVETVIPSMPAREAQAILADRLTRMHRGGSTHLHAGWLHGAQAIAPHTSDYGVSRVILLSDGQATDGLRDPEAFAAEATRLAEAGVGSSTYGIGNNFNEALMTRIAADGNAFYAETADALAGYFDNEFSLLSKVVGRRVRLTATAKVEGLEFSITNLNGHLKRDEGWALPNLIAGAETWVALSFEAPALAAGTSVEVALSVSWLDTAGASNARELTLLVPVKARAPKKEDSWAAERVREARASDIQRQAAAQAIQGDWAGVTRSVASLQGMSANNAYIRGVSESLSVMAATGDARRFAKEATYASNAMSNRQTLTTEDAATMSIDTLGLRKIDQGAVAAPDAK